MKQYQFKALIGDKYRVMRTDLSLAVGDKGRYIEYMVDLHNGDMMCDCPGFQAKMNAFRKGKRVKGTIACKHVKDILAQLKDGGGIIDFSFDD